METVKEKSSENLHFSRTFIKVEGVNCSMTDVATIHFKKTCGEDGEKPQSLWQVFRLWKFL